MQALDDVGTVLATSGKFTVADVAMGTIVLGKSWAYVAGDPNKYNVDEYNIVGYVQPTSGGGVTKNFSVAIEPSGNIAVLTLSGQEMSYDDQLPVKSYFLNTGSSGVAGAKFAAAISAGIVSVKAGYGSRDSAATQELVFLDRDPEGGRQSPLIFDGVRDDVLYLDDLPGTQVGVSVDPAQISIPQTTKVVVVVNNEMASPVVEMRDLIAGTVGIPKAYFLTGGESNTYYWMSADGVTGSIESCTAEGSTDNYPPSDGTLGAPYPTTLAIQTVNDQVLSKDGGVEFTIPKYADIKKGDKITLICYMNNTYYPNSSRSHVGQATGEVVVDDASVSQTCLIPAELLYGYSSARASGVGTLDAYYVVERSGKEVEHSRKMMPRLEINT
ncbi:hypothetical protein PAN31117_05084 [Pandoraea anapnoica]|uniref:Uncharacterized protein n=1 Tax=Pandoraea anapnoica TaxID=2508301 RepID=A0A5E5ARG2_9BURK|nr:hypothetical protein PIN31009_05316 [Pandoraea iniqua]VVE75113.1 hypothetical protein PAN31117_05084 [Pandoraea anapnoica]